MNAINVSVNKACAALLGIFCTLSAGVLAGFYLLTGQAAVLLLGLLYIFLVLVCGALFICTPFFTMLENPYPQDNICLSCGYDSIAAIMIFRYHSFISRYAYLVRLPVIIIQGI